MQWIIPSEHGSMQDIVSHASTYGDILSINPYKPTLLSIFRQHIEAEEEVQA
jgi:hypothetical protein